MTEWLVLLPAVGVAGLILDWYMNRAKQPQRNQRLDILHEVWRMLPVDPEFTTDERNQPDQ